MLAAVLAEQTPRYMRKENVILIRLYESPCGLLRLGSWKDSLCLCDWSVEKHSVSVDRHLKKGLDVPLLFLGTDFQKRVWRELLDIPYGTTVSYVEMARRIGMPKAVRAVANANGANIISIFAPCHRVIGSNHSLTGYRGGLEAKRALLALEGIRDVL